MRCINCETELLPTGARGRPRKTCDANCALEVKRARQRRDVYGGPCATCTLPLPAQSCGAPLKHCSDACREVARQALRDRPSVNTDARILTSVGLLDADQDELYGFGVERLKPPREATEVPADADWRTKFEAEFGPLNQDDLGFTRPNLKTIGAWDRRAS